MERITITKQQARRSKQTRNTTARPESDGKIKVGVKHLTTDLNMAMICHHGLVRSQGYIGIGINSLDNLDITIGEVIVS